MKFKEFEIFHLWKMEPKRGILSSYLCRLRKQTIDMERGQKSEWNRHQFRQKRPKIERDGFRDFWCSWETPKNEEDEVMAVNGEGEFDPWFLCSASGSIWVKTGSISVQKNPRRFGLPRDRSIKWWDRSIPFRRGFFFLICRSASDWSIPLRRFFLWFDVSFGSIDPLLRSIDPAPADFFVIRRQLRIDRSSSGINRSNPGGFLH